MRHIAASFYWKIHVLGMILLTLVLVSLVGLRLPKAGLAQGSRPHVVAVSCRS